MKEDKKTLKLDFLCVGFVKCGTTSLHDMLSWNKEIYLPIYKESHFFEWKDKVSDPIEVLRKVYYPNYRKSQIVGGIEPSFVFNAKDIYEYFGKDIKLIFMIRNPVEADISCFKMSLRGMYSLKYVRYYRKYKNDFTKIYDAHIRQVIQEKNGGFVYVKYIKEFLQYYDMSQIKIVLFEDFINDTERIMDEIQDFIGVTCKSYSCAIHSNAGKKVCKNYYCACIQYILQKLSNLFSPESIFRPVMMEIRKYFEKYLLVESKEKPSDKSLKMLMKYYRPSIKELEKVIGRELDGVWF